MTEPEGLLFVRNLIASHEPPSPMAQMFGTEVVAADEGHVTLVSRPGANANSRRGTIHGGVICTLLDTAVVLAAVTCCDPVRSYTTVDLTTHFMRSATAGEQDFTTYAEVLKPGARISFVQGRVEDAEGRVLATATASVFVG